MLIWRPNITECRHSSATSVRAYCAVALRGSLTEASLSMGCISALSARIPQLARADASRRPSRIFSSSVIRSKILVPYNEMYLSGTYRRPGTSGASQSTSTSG
ncbi:Uncharacterised protein [Mycobacteroides abscessus subsp. abscessus]|nr:Uncharacterised protein [Mycobacteroides abscessus subsp. abscessus]